MIAKFLCICDIAQRPKLVIFSRGIALDKLLLDLIIIIILRAPNPHRPYAFTRSL